MKYVWIAAELVSLSVRIPARGIAIYTHILICCGFYSLCTKVQHYCVLPGEARAKGTL